MKKSFSIAMLLIVLSIILTPVQAQAAKKSAVQKKADAATKDITSYANYYGWEVTAKVKKVSKTQVTKSIRMEKTGNIYYAYTQVTKKSGSKYSTTFTSKKVKYTASEVKSGLKKWSTSKDVKTLLQNRAKAKVTSLVTYGKKFGFTAKSSTKATTKKATTTVTFSHSKAKATATVTVARNKKSPKISYKLAGKKSSAKKIKAWLKSNKATSSEVTAALSAQQLADVAKAKAKELTTLAEAKNWSVTASGEGTTKITLGIENSKYEFTATVEVVDNSGTAEVRYTRDGVASTLEKITTWLTKYQAAPISNNVVEVPQSELVALAKTESDKLVAAGKAKQWEVSTTGTGTVEVSINFANSKHKFDAKIKAIAQNGKATATYTRMGGTSTYDQIIEWINKFAVETPAGNGGDTPQPDINGPASVEDLVKAAKAEMNTLVAEATKLDWTYTKTSEGSGKVRGCFENSEWKFYASVEATTTDGQTTFVYGLATKASDADVEATKQEILDWFTEYKAAPKKPNGSVTEPDTEEPGTEDPGKPDIVPVTQEDLNEAAQSAIGEIKTTAEAKDWKVIGYGFDTSVASASMELKNSRYYFSTGTKAVDNGDGTIKVEYYLKGSRASKDLILSWLDEYRATPITDPDNSDNNGENQEPVTPTDRTEELAQAAKDAATGLTIESILSNWSSEEISNTGTEIQVKFTRFEDPYFIVGVKATLDGDNIKISYTLTEEGSTEKVVTYDEISERFTKSEPDSGNNSGSDNGNSGDTDNGDNTGDSGDNTGKPISPAPNGPVTDPDIGDFQERPTAA